MFPWSSRLLRYAKSRPNGKLIYNSIMNGPYVKRMIPEPGNLVTLCQQMKKGSDIGIQEKKLKFINDWKGLHTDGESIESLTTPYQNGLSRQKVGIRCLSAVQNQGVQNVGNQNGIIVVPGITNQNPNGNGNVVAARLRISSIQLQAEEFDLMAAAADLDEIEEVNANCILMANLQQASTSEEQYTDLLEPIPEPHQVQQNDSNVISKISSVRTRGEEQ
ncbi:hypothetical protein Tco_0093315 [Tanacetum coccineum]